MVRLSGPHWSTVIVPIRVLSMGQIELFNHLLFLKPFNCVLKNELLVYLKILLPTNYSLIYKNKIGIKWPTRIDMPWEPIDLKKKLTKIITNTSQT